LPVPAAHHFRRAGRSAIPEQLTSEQLIDIALDAGANHIIPREQGSVDRFGAHDLPGGASKHIGSIQQGIGCQLTKLRVNASAFRRAASQKVTNDLESSICREHLQIAKR